MRIVVDTGVLVSAALKADTLPALAVRRAAKIAALLKSEATEQELLDVIDRPYLVRLLAPAARDYVIALIAAAERVDVHERIGVCRDPKDDKFLEVAVNGHADLIVTGDKDLLVLDPFRALRIVTPAGLFEILRG